MAESYEKRATRVTLLDAVNLDKETHTMLKDQLSKATKFLSASFLVKWEAEMDALLRYGIWRLSVCRHHATFGQQMLRVKYGSDFTKKKGQLLIALTVGCTYLKQKISQISNSTEDSSSKLHHIKRMLSTVEVIVLLASLINLMVFLRHGDYPTLIDRVLRLKPVSTASPGLNRVAGYQYMTRELLWHGFIELITFTLPLINYQSIKRKITNLLSKSKIDHKSVKRRTEEYLPDTNCAICDDIPILPHHIGCIHTFCYYCLESNRLADKKFECPLCGHPAKNIISLTVPQNSRLVGL
ncbi:peroxisome biogenesis factor 2-like [Lycorma delicatula]|uniref:peroxisome biogenesis factor 2-like n=1 Tax=Lycorma delicatula TaxID=130591 RepID=UPI003F513820